MSQPGLHSATFTPLWDPDEADRLLPSITTQGVRVIETPLLDPEGFDFIGTRHAAERLGIEIVCLLGLPDELDVLTQAD
ncbi:MAG: hypothetical protein QNL02_09470 [Paracoccaceae bacterium]|jgi:D-psicose/D-tagatose/L-ribulose 3-epimerase|tara:strand:+ start:838 stop:1074 length:237 start_codon:yes stop_codon:yes gene_type:complete